MHIFIKNKMKKKLSKIIEVPKGIEINLEGNKLTVKGPEGENKKTFNITNLIFEKKDNQIIMRCEKATKKEKKMMNTISAHIKNMIKGVQKKFEYKLKVCFSHFPITVEIKESEAIIKNFLGEKIPRKVKIPGDVEVEADKEIITITSFDKELAGQTAANFETATRIKKKDRRIFQDGIFITNKDGREM